MSIWWGVYAADFVVTMSLTTWWTRRFGNEPIDRFDKRWTSVSLLALPFFVVAVFSANRVTSNHHAPITLVILTAALYFAALAGPRLLHNAAIRRAPRAPPNQRAHAPAAKRRRVR